MYMQTCSISGKIVHFLLEYKSVDNISRQILYKAVQNSDMCCFPMIVKQMWFITKLSLHMQSANMEVLSLKKKKKKVFYENVLPFQIWLQKVQQLRSDCSDEHSLEFWTFPVPMVCCITIQSLLREGQQLRRYHPDEYSLEFLTFSVTLTLTTTEQSNLSQSSMWWYAIKPSLVVKGSAVQKIY